MIHLILFLGLSIFCVQATDSSIQKPTKSAFSKIKGRFSKNKKPFSEDISSHSTSSQDEDNISPTTGSHSTNSQELANFPPSQRDQEFLHKAEARIPSCWENIEKFNDIASRESIIYERSETQKKKAAEYRDFLITKYRTLFDLSKNRPLALDNRCKKEEAILGPFLGRLMNERTPRNKAEAAVDRKINAELEQFKKNHRLYKAPTRTQKVKMAINNKLGR